MFFLINAKRKGGREDPELSQAISVLFFSINAKGREEGGPYALPIDFVIVFHNKC